MFQAANPRAGRRRRGGNCSVWHHWRIANIERAGTRAGCRHRSGDRQVTAYAGDGRRWKQQHRHRGEVAQVGRGVGRGRRVACRAVLQQAKSRGHLPAFHACRRRGRLAGCAVFHSWPMRRGNFAGDSGAFVQASKYCRHQGGHRQY